MSRHIPADVKKQLRAEVGFGCPVPDCGSPYLEWHHFDPPFHVEPHHRPEGMIALCRKHHIEADNGAFAVDQLATFKSRGTQNWLEVKGRFNWLRNRLLAVVGGNFYYETLIIFQFREVPIIWFERDEQNYLMLNVRMLTTSGEPRAEIRNNDWYNTGLEEDVVCPPSAKFLRIKYPNGDELRIEFFELQSIDDMLSKYPNSAADRWELEFPITAVEVTNVVANSGLEFGPAETKFGGNTMRGCFSSHCGAGLSID